jgi:hypothetical protein
MRWGVFRPRTQIFKTLKAERKAGMQKFTTGQLLRGETAVEPFSEIDLVACKP